ncbi:SanA/YdcF family protein [Micromonospora craniellae]|uniref:SanA/YdcF family protein n=1 Tax=Micromonospora craniellae TaxID=2294034 RepID=UPI001CC646A8|nr:YdcF family protein [Micromonospora craniellae]
MTDPAPAGSPAGWRRRLIRVTALIAVALLLVSVPWLWTTVSARGHVYSAADAPTADVVIVLGTAVTENGQRPGIRLAGRLETAAELVHSGRARVVLVSGDGGGTSGDDPAAMAAHLTGQLGVDPQRVVADPHGLDTYDSCLRARDGTSTGSNGP